MAGPPPPSVTSPSHAEHSGTAGARAVVTIVALEVHRGRRSTAARRRFHRIGPTPISGWVPPRSTSPRRSPPPASPIPRSAPRPRRTPAHHLLSLEEAYTDAEPQRALGQRRALRRLPDATGQRRRPQLPTGAGTASSWAVAMPRTAAAHGDPRPDLGAHVVVRSGGQTVADQLHRQRGRLQGDLGSGPGQGPRRRRGPRSPTCCSVRPMTSPRPTPSASPDPTCSTSGVAPLLRPVHGRSDRPEHRA